ncbi:protein of unknown function [Xenorhabdus poinarii G6]|uniref:Uncharacterized protein n=1 Tax=Xenorhabdus poinarii G6 TaxID=1354304 RepID=A0A068R5J1_9GAMM|nr:protein of unknown function [Xenorhabdus poinarii G6]
MWKVFCPDGLFQAVSLFRLQYKSLVNMHFPTGAWLRDVLDQEPIYQRIDPKLLVFFRYSLAEDQQNMGTLCNIHDSMALTDT